MLGMYPAFQKSVVDDTDPLFNFSKTFSRNPGSFSLTFNVSALRTTVAETTKPTSARTPSSKGARASLQPHSANDLRPPTAARRKAGGDKRAPLAPTRSIASEQKEADPPPHTRERATTRVLRNSMHRTALLEDECSRTLARMTVSATPATVATARGKKKRDLERKGV